MENQPVGVVGIGLLGSAIAERMIRAGFHVVGYDIDPDRMKAFVEMGGEPAESASAVAGCCGRIVLSLLTTEIVESVVAEMGAALRPGQILIDTTTGEPEGTVALGARLAGRRVHYLDATVSGSSAQARQGDVLVMVGGEHAALESCQDILRSFAKRWEHVGQWGSGAKMKLVTNLVLGLNRAALAEALALAKRVGLDPALTLDILKSGAAYSYVMDAKGEKMVHGDFSTQARLAQHHKDVRLILAMGEQVGAKLPLSALHDQLLAQAEAAGYGEADNSAILKAFE